MQTAQKLKRKTPRRLILQKCESTWIASSSVVEESRINRSSTNSAQNKIAIGGASCRSVLSMKKKQQTLSIRTEVTVRETGGRAVARTAIPFPNDSHRRLDRSQPTNALFALSVEPPLLLRFCCRSPRGTSVTALLAQGLRVRCAAR